VLSTAIEANLSLNGRYAFPIYVTSIIMITVALGQLIASKGRRHWLHTGLAAVSLVVLGSHILRTSVRSYEAFKSGIGYASLTWSNSPTMGFLRDLPDNAIVYSNGKDAVSYVLERQVQSIPERVRPRTGLADPANPYEKQLLDMRNNLAKSDAYVVFFDNIDWRFYLATEAELKQRLSLEQVATKSDGRIFRMTNSFKKE
jgi:hypothetical protein